MNTRTLATDTPERLAEAVEHAVAELRRQQPVALPTETVYGLAADALHPEAAGRIFAAKERPFFDPLICHLPDLEWLPRMAKIPSESALLVDALVARFWPGPLTLVLPRQDIVPDMVTSGLETVALRMSAHPIFQSVTRAFGGPLAAPSANRFGRISPTAAEHVEKELGGRIPVIVDGGPTTHGVESTIVRIVGDNLQILRPGPIALEDLAAFGPLLLPAVQPSGEDAPLAPGQLKSHYAPLTPFRLVDRIAEDWSDPQVGVLSWRGLARPERFGKVEVLSPAGDLLEAAATLFAKLRRLDEAGLPSIIGEHVPGGGLALAIMDRLRKAQGLP